jgi:hypothetical protein
MAPKLRSIHVDGSITSVPRMPPDLLSREREAGTTSGHRNPRGSRDPSPTTRLIRVGTMSGGSEALGPGPFPHSPPLANRTRRHSSWDVSRVVAIGGRPPGPWIQAKTRQPSNRSAKTSPTGALPPRATERAVGRLAYARPTANLSPCVVPVNSVDGSKGAYSPFRQDIGDFSAICSAVYPSTSLTSALQGNEMRRVRVVGRSPYGATCFPESSVGPGSRSDDRTGNQEATWARLGRRSLSLTAARTSSAPRQRPRCSDKT